MVCRPTASQLWLSARSTSSLIHAAKSASSFPPSLRLVHSSSSHAQPTDQPPPAGTPYSSLTIGVPKEVFQNERRVAITPQNVVVLKKKGFSSVLVERDAGTAARFLDQQYVAAGANIVSRDELYASSDITLKVRPPLLDQEINLLKPSSSLVSFLYPVQNKDIVDALASRNINAFAVSSPLHESKALAAGTKPYLDGYDTSNLSSSSIRCTKVCPSRSGSNV
jgi:H+-translocating NAD(P) transhydrogenase